MNEHFEAAIQDVQVALSLDDKVEVTEALARVERMFAVEDTGYKVLFGGDFRQDEHGPTLEQIKKISETIREDAVGNPVMKRALGLRKSYVMSKGINIPGFEFTPVVKKRGAPSKEQKFFSNPVNRKTLVDSSARETMEQTAFTDGVIFHLGDNSTKTVRQIPLWEIAGYATHPEFATEIIAIKREWESYNPATDTSETKTAWYYISDYEGHRDSMIGEHPVDKSKTMFFQNFNAQSGWVWGTPDATSSVIWSKVYTELLNYGKAMTKTLAQLAVAYRGGKKASSSKVGVELARSQAGGVVGVGDGELTALSTAGKTYDFGGLRPVAAMVATGVEVSVVHLLSDPGAAGSSYGSAQNLDLPTKRAIVARQDVWATYLERIVRWGTGNADIQVTFPSLDEPEPYREMQVATLAYNSGTIHPDEMRPRILKIAQIEPLHESTPEGARAPNPGELNGSLASAPAPDQGQSNGAGGQGSLGHDID